VPIISYKPLTLMPGWGFRTVSRHPFHLSGKFAGRKWPGWPGQYPPEAAEIPVADLRIARRSIDTATGNITFYG
jgi:hypothetical protein